MKKILIIDDEKDIRILLSSILKDEGYDTILVGSVKEAEITIEKLAFDLVLLDISLDDKNKDGIYLLRKIKKLNSHLPVIMISGHATIQQAVDSVKLGAFEFLEKPFNTDRLLIFVNRAFENIELKLENKKLTKLFFDTYEIIGDSEEIKKINTLVKKISVGDARALISGPVGSGKELVARTIHKYSERKDHPFLVCNGAILEPSNFDIELFGLEKNDGTIMQGFFEKANNGTLLIDNVSEIPLETQTKILRVLTEQKFHRVGGDKHISTNVRVLSSTSKDLRIEIEAGNFREDLLQRLSVVEIKLPSLLERSSDIPLLMDYFSKKISANLGKKAISFNSNYTKLYNHHWSGNVRELRNLIERVIILSDGSEKNIESIINDSIDLKSVSNFNNFLDFDSPLKTAREHFEKEYLMHQLKKMDQTYPKLQKILEWKDLLCIAN